MIRPMFHSCAVVLAYGTVPVCVCVYVCVCVCVCPFSHSHIHFCIFTILDWIFITRNSLLLFFTQDTLYTKSTFLLGLRWFSMRVLCGGHMTS